MGESIADAAAVGASLLFLGLIAVLCRIFGWRALLWPKQAVRGWLAEDAGHGLDSNPYRPGTSEFKAWKSGWQASRETNP